MKDWLWFCLHNIHDLSSQRRSEKVFSFLHVEHQFESLFNSSTNDKNVFLVSYVKPNHRLNFTVQWVLSKKLTIFCPFAYLCDASTVLPADWLVFREIPKVRPIALKGPYSWRNASLKWNSAWVNLKQYQSGSKCHHLPSSSLRWYGFGTMENFPTKWNIDAIRPFNSEPHGSFALRRINWFRDYYYSLFFYRRVTTCFRLNWGVKITFIICVSKRLHILLRERTG